MPELESVTATKTDISDQSTVLATFESAFDDFKIFLDKLIPIWSSVPNEERLKILQSGKFPAITYAKTVKEYLDKWFPDMEALK